MRGVEYYSFLRAAEAIDRAHVAVLVDRCERRLHDRGQEDREPRDGGRSGVPGRREQVGSRRGEGPDVQGPRPEIRPFAHASASEPRPLGPGDAPSASAVHGPPSEVERSDADVEGQRDHPAGATGRPTPRATGTLHYATQVSTGPPTFVIFGGAHEPEAPVSAVPRESAPPGARPCRRVPVRLRFEGRGRALGGEPRALRIAVATGRGAAWLARLTGGQKVAGSNPAGPTDESGPPGGRRRRVSSRSRTSSRAARIALIPVFVAADHRSRHDDRGLGPLRDRRRHGLGRRHDRPPDRTGVRGRQDPRPGGRPARDRRRSDRARDAGALPAVGGGSDPRPRPDRPRGRARSPLSERGVRIEVRWIGKLATFSLMAAIPWCRGGTWGCRSPPLRSSGLGRLRGRDRRVLRRGLGLSRRPPTSASLSWCPGIVSDVDPA